MVRRRAASRTVLSSRWMACVTSTSRMRRSGWCVTTRVADRVEMPHTPWTATDTARSRGPVDTGGAVKLKEWKPPGTTVWNTTAPAGSTTRTSTAVSSPVLVVNWRSTLEPGAALVSPSTPLRKKLVTRGRPPLKAARVSPRR